MQCPCGSDKIYDRCCGPFLSSEQSPPTAEALMRARYTAYTLENLDFIERTWAPESLKDFDLSAAKKWAEQSTWLGLQILSIDKGRAEDKTGAVEFVASFRQAGETIEHHEVSHFRKMENGEWRFVSGDTRIRKGDSGQRAEKQQTIVRDAPKVGRNDACPCGSGKKYKKCCGA
jgi:SEC-C motif-containing protein